jgi:hypothetical protein
LLFAKTCTCMFVLQSFTTTTYSTLRVFLRQTVNTITIFLCSQVECVSNIFTVNYDCKDFYTDTLISEKTSDNTLHNSLSNFLIGLRCMFSSTILYQNRKLSNQYFNSSRLPDIYTTRIRLVILVPLRCFLTDSFSISFYGCHDATVPASLHSIRKLCI